MADHPDASIEEQLWSVAAARILLGPDVHVQAPPNLAYDDFPLLLDAGIDDWGGVSPVTVDHVNPGTLAACRAAEGGVQSRGLELAPRLPSTRSTSPTSTVGPTRSRTRDPAGFDAHGLAREDRWAPGEPVDVPFIVARDPAPVGLVGDELGRPSSCGSSRPGAGARACLRVGRPAPT